jgi:hypothetical protein
MLWFIDPNSDDDSVGGPYAKIIWLTALVALILFGIVIVAILHSAK